MAVISNSRAYPLDTSSYIRRFYIYFSFERKINGVSAKFFEFVLFNGNDRSESINFLFFEKKRGEKFGKLEKMFVGIKVDIATAIGQECFRLKIWPAAVTYN